MSHYTEVKHTKINDLPMLMKTLEILGYGMRMDHFIMGDQGRRRVDLAVKIDGKYCVGFKKNRNGSYDVVADWFYAKTSSKRFIPKLQQTYNTEKVIHEAQSRGYSLIQQKVVNGAIRLVLRKIS